MHLGLSISPIAQVKKPRCSPLHLRFLTRTLEEISCASAQVIFLQFFTAILKKTRKKQLKNQKQYWEFCLLVIPAAWLCPPMDWLHQTYLA